MTAGEARAAGRPWRRTGARRASRSQARMLVVQRATPSVPISRWPRARPQPPTGTSACSRERPASSETVTNSEAPGAERGNQALDRPHRLRAVAAAVVEQHDPAPLALRRRRGDDLVDPRPPPVLAVEVGEHDVVAAAGDRLERGGLPRRTRRPGPTSTAAGRDAGGCRPPRRARCPSGRAAAAAPSPGAPRRRRA